MKNPGRPGLPKTRGAKKPLVPHYGIGVKGRESFSTHYIPPKKFHYTYNTKDMISCSHIWHINLIFLISRLGHLVIMILT